MAQISRSSSSKKRMSRVGSKSGIVRHDIHSSANGRAIGEGPVARPGGGGFWSGFNKVVFGKQELEIPEEVATDRLNYIEDVKDVLATKEGMMPGHTYQDDLKHRFKELMRKNATFRELSGPELLDVLVKAHPDENPFRGDRYDRLQMRIQEQVKEVQIAKVTQRQDAKAFAARTGAAPTLSRAPSKVTRWKDAEPPSAYSKTDSLKDVGKRRSGAGRAVSANTATPSEGMKGVRGRNRAQTFGETPSLDAGHTRQRSIKFQDEAVDSGGGFGASRSMSLTGEEGDTVGDLPPSTTGQQQGPGFLTRMFSGKQGLERK